MKHIKKFNNQQIFENKSNYHGLVEQLGQENVDLIQDNFDELRFKFLRYILRGDEFATAVESTAYDVLEGSDIMEIDENVINYLKVLLVFNNPEEFGEISNEF